MSITNFPMSLQDVKDLAVLAGDRQNTEALVRLIAKGREAAEWIAKLPATSAPVEKPKQPA